MMKVTILTENTVYKRGLLGEHGLSLLVDTGRQRYLFDTGQSRVFVHNAAKLGIDLKGLDGVILSHGHYDHGGGLEYWQELGNVPIYVQEKAFEKKYNENSRTGKLYYIGLEDKGGWQKKADVRKLSGGGTQIADGVYLLSEIPYTTHFEPVPGCFWKFGLQHPGDELLVDKMEDEQLLVIEAEEGLCVFAGCAHAGIINCLRYVQTIFPGKHIHCLVAGMHLKNSDAGRIEETIRALKEIKIDIVVPVHCTGICAIAKMRESLGSVCILPEVGKEIAIENKWREK